MWWLRQAHFFYNAFQYPGELLGRKIDNLPEDVEKIYKEIRETIKNSCFTAAVLLGRKLIMHIAVDITEAKEGEKFVKYIKYLKEAHYIPPHGDKILEFMKEIGNEKNHEIKIGSAKEAKKLLKFIENLLIHAYETPAEFVIRACIGA